jgi:hypothetical protein
LCIYTLIESYGAAGSGLHADLKLASQLTR